ncbi:hypothetical protein H0H81_008907 [Sphagnurus paluster]|uniref:Uncharacterized protein n=1 Tax=Sphagnurus paluster TaxID=117069 RepID=A0A9P7KI82_9AGAR|nr:hypothetical protein H0H81_008907 [Sphagnurus paluster]
MGGGYGGTDTADSAGDCIGDWGDNIVQARRIQGTCRKCDPNSLATVSTGVLPNRVRMVL